VVVSGIDANFSDLLQLARGQKIGGRDVCIKEVIRKLQDCDIREAL